MFRFEHEQKAFHNNKIKDGLTVFAELNTDGELCKKDKLSSIYNASPVSYFYFVLCRLSCISKRKVERVFKFEHERKVRKIDNLTVKSGFLVRFLIFSRFLVALCIINYVYPYCC